MNCSRFQKLIALFAEGDLAGRKSRRVEKHLVTCVACRQFAQELSWSQGVLKGLGSESIDNRAFQSIQDRVLDQISLREKSIRPTWPLLRWSWRWTQVLVFGLLILGGLALWKNSFPRKTFSDLAERNEKSVSAPLWEEESNRTTPLDSAQAKVTAGGKSARRSISAEGPGRSKQVRVTRSVPIMEKPSPASTPGNLAFNGLHVFNSSAEIVEPAIQIAQRESAQGNLEPTKDADKPDPLVIKLVTDDPEVVIVWLVDPDKGERQ